MEIYSFQWKCELVRPTLLGSIFYGIFHTIITIFNGKIALFAMKCSSYLLIKVTIGILVPTISKLSIKS